MGATEQQMDMLSEMHVTHVSYILLLYSISFLLFLFVSILLNLYAESVWPIEKKAVSSSKLPKANGTPNGRLHEFKDDDEERGLMNGHARRGSVDPRVKDAEEFELEGLMSEDDGEEDERLAGRRKDVEEGRI